MADPQEKENQQLSTKGETPPAAAQQPHKPSLWPDSNVLKTGWRCKCPRCQIGDLYESGFMAMTIRAHCAHCGLKLSDHDCADGPAVFLIFVLGFSLVPLALLLDALVVIPLWVHGVVWSIVALGATLGSLRPLKAYIIALQYKHLPWDQNEGDQEGNEDNKEDAPQ
ncbi:MAG: DUF983 domain-containing protein [Alphaproteobacteria bacterium]